MTADRRKIAVMPSGGGIFRPHEEACDLLHLWGGNKPGVAAPKQTEMSLPPERP
jgi:hypothetical protein